MSRPAVGAPPAERLLRSATTTMSGSTVSGSKGICTSCIAIPETPMNPADRPGDIARRCPPMPARTEQRRQCEAGKQGGDHHPGKRLREVLERQAGPSSAAFERRHRKDGARHDQQVERHRLSFDVVQVVRELDRATRRCRSPYP